MASIDDAIKYLRTLFEDEANADATLQRRQRELNPADFDDNRERYERPRKDARDAIARYLDSPVLRYGRHFDRHGALIKKFHEVAPYAKSAFIMTKYPEGDGADAKRLQSIIDLVSASLAAAKLAPRIAKEAQYHAALWDNVELHALGCQLGVAIAESHYLPEFNPNVAMEWGWMRGMGRPVILLVEKDFNLRADVEGITRATFDWTDPDATVGPAMTTAIETLKGAGRL